MTPQLVKTIVNSTGSLRASDYFEDKCSSTFKLMRSIGRLSKSPTHVHNGVEVYYKYHYIVGRQPICGYYKIPFKGPKPLKNITGKEQICKHCLKKLANTIDNPLEAAKMIEDVKQQPRRLR